MSGQSVNPTLDAAFELANNYSFRQGNNSLTVYEGALYDQLCDTLKVWMRVLKKNLEQQEDELERPGDASS